MNDRIIEFINDGFVDVREFGDSLINLKLLNSYINTEKISLTNNLIKNILNNNILDNTISYFLNQDSSLILKQISSIESIIPILEYYCNNRGYNLKNKKALLNIFSTGDVTENINNDYLRDISKIPLLSKEETVELFKKYNEGDEQAKEELIKSNLRLVVSVAKQFLNRGLDYIDLVQEGNLGLIKAVEKYDFTMEKAFSTYAYNWIKLSIRRAIDNKARTIRIPIGTMEKIRKYAYLIDMMTDELNRTPTTKEVSVKMNISESEVIRISKIKTKVVSLNDTVNDSDDEFGDFLESDIDIEEDYNSLEFKNVVELLLQNSNLTERQIEIIKLRYGFYGEIMTCEDIGKIFGMTKQGVHQLIKKILLRIRTSNYVKYLLEYAYDKESATNIINEAKTMVKTKPRSDTK